MSPMPAKWKTIARAVEQVRLGRQVADVADLERQVGVARVVREIGFPSAAEVVQDPDAETACEQDVHHVTADEAGATGDHRHRLHGHAALVAFMVRTLK